MEAKQIHSGQKFLMEVRQLRTFSRQTLSLSLVQLVWLVGTIGTVSAVRGAEFWH